MKKEIPVKSTEEYTSHNLLDYAYSKWKYAEPQETPPKTHVSEKEVSQEPEYDKGVKMWVVYVFVFVASFIISSVSYYNYQANNKIIEANKQIQILSNSTGAIIEKLLNEKAYNQKGWEVSQRYIKEAKEQIERSNVAQAEYNASTYRIDEEIKKFGISVTQ